MERAHLAIAAAATVAASWFIFVWLRDQQAAPAELPEPDESTDTTTDDAEASIADNIMQTVRQTLQLWRPPVKYAGMVASAEAAYDIPSDMLARLLYQECRWREDVITGRTTSPVGALGIAQFMPATAREMGINPLDPEQAIPAAARYLKSLYGRFGTWAQALAAYNWGQGNVARKGLTLAPAETRNYYTQILADVNAANGTTYA